MRLILLFTLITFASPALAFAPISLCDVAQAEFDRALAEQATDVLANARIPSRTEWLVPPMPCGSAIVYAPAAYYAELEGEVLRARLFKDLMLSSQFSVTYERLTAP